MYLNVKKTGLCITVNLIRMLNAERHESYLNATGVEFFRLQMNGNLTQIRHSKFQYQPRPTARNGSLEMLQSEISRGFDPLENQF